MGSKSSQSTTQQQKSTVHTNTATVNDGEIYNNFQNVKGAITLTDRGATNDAFEFAEGVLLQAGDFTVDLIAQLTERDEKFLESVASKVNDTAAPDLATIDKFIQFGTVAAVVAAGAWAFKGT
jgi:hypothetical protein